MYCFLTKKYILLSPTVPPKNTFLVLLKRKIRGIKGHPKWQEREVNLLF
jgi:hypothetical protein